MSSFDKTVRLACKPKAAPPKAKYMDPIISATYSEDGAIHDVCKALAPRFREPNSIVVFKALIVLHSMIKNGSTDNVLTYLSTEDVLKLRNVSDGQWDGYNAPKNLQKYAAYLDARIKTYRDLKHDPIRVQTDSNMDRRVESTLDDGRATSSARFIQRSKTLIGRKLRSMTVEKGLLRETKAVQRTIAALLDCKFYTDNLEDELNVTALRLLVKDLLILFQASNEGVMNVLEHYFEMSHVDAESALNIYRTFCKQTERVVEYLGVAKKLQNLLNIPIPNLKFAPVSLAAALEDYLKDPEFEQKRLEYRSSKARGGANGIKRDGPASKPEILQKGASTSKAPNTASDLEGTKDNNPEEPRKDNAALVDFFSSIEEQQPTMFNPITNSPSSTYFQQQAALNPFMQRQSMTMTSDHSPLQAFIPSQPTGFVLPQHTAMPTVQLQGVGVGSALQQQQQPPQFPFQPVHSTAFLQPLQPQTTASNPFRQSMLFPQATGQQFVLNSGSGAGAPYVNSSSMQNSLIYTQQSTSLFGQPLHPLIPNPTASTVAAQTIPHRPASTPITNGKVTQPVISHVTGSRNPFGVPQETAPPLPKAPTLLELKTGYSENSIGSGSLTEMTSTSQQSQQLPVFQKRTLVSNNVFNATTLSSGHNNNGSSVMSGVASSFSFNNNTLDSGKKPESFESISTISSPLSSQSTGFTPSTLFGQPTGATASSSHPTGSATTSSMSLNMSPLQSQSTGFSGLKPFKPTSSFGASLLESLPPIPQAEEPSDGSPNKPAFSSAYDQPVGGLPSSLSTNKFPTNEIPSFPAGTHFLSGLPSSSQYSTPSGNQFSLLNSQPTDLQQMTGLGEKAFQKNQPSSLGVGLRPQVTGGGSANPFRASMLASSAPGGFSSPSGSPFGASNVSGVNATSNFGAIGPLKPTHYAS